MATIEPLIQRIYENVDQRITERLADDEERVRAIVRDELRRMFESAAEARAQQPGRVQGVPMPDPQDYFSTDTGEESEP